MKEEEQQVLSYLWHIAFTKFSGLHVGNGSKLLLALLHTQLWSYLNVSFRDTILGFRPTVHTLQIKSEIVLFMKRTFSTQWFTVSYNLTKISSKTIIPLYNTLPFWQSLALRAKRAHKGKEEATQSKVWTARDVFGENILLCKSTPGGLNRPCCSWMLGLGSEAVIFNPHPDYNVQTLSKETSLVSSTPSHPSLSLVSCLPLGSSL